MKKIILIILSFSFTISYAQNDSVHNSSERFFITTTINYNLPGIGSNLNLGYNISRHFSVILSSGYMVNHTNSQSYLQQSTWDYNAKDYIETTYYDAEETHRFIPINLSIRYNFSVLGVQSYIFYQAGWYFLLDEGNYNVSIITKYRESNQIIESINGKATDIYNISKTNSRHGSGIGAGIFIPITNLLKIDISYTYLGFTNQGAMFQSLGLGLNFIIK